MVYLTLLSFACETRSVYPAKIDYNVTRHNVMQMTFADHVFHNRYLLADILSVAPYDNRWTNKSKKILSTGENILMNMGLTLGGEQSLDEIDIIFDDEYHDKHGKYPLYQDLSLEQRAEMLNVLLSLAPEIRIELLSPMYHYHAHKAEYEAEYDIVKASGSRGVTVDDFLQVWFAANKEFQDTAFGDHIYFEGFYPDGDYKFRICYGS